MLAYLQKRIKLRKDNGNLIEDYFSLLPKSLWLTRENMLLISKIQLQNINTPLFEFMARNIDSAEMLLKGEVMPGIIHDQIFSAQIATLEELIKNRNEIRFEKIFIRANNLMPLKVRAKPWFEKPSNDYWRIYYFKRTGDYAKFIQLASFYYDTAYMKLSPLFINKKDTILLQQALSAYQDTSLVKLGIQQGIIEMTKEAFRNYFSNRVIGELNTAAEIIVFNSNKQSMLTKALQWLKKSNDVKQTPENLYIQGLLYYKLNKSKQSLEWFEKGLQVVTDEKLKAKINLAKNAVKEGKPFESFAKSIDVNQ